VIFELGFFIGKLGRERVCALFETGVEIPSDYAGVVFVELDPRQSWRFEVAKEIRAAGLPVDLNDVIYVLRTMNDPC
jgi:predicted nucleotide-binding protein